MRLSELPEGQMTGESLLFFLDTRTSQTGLAEVADLAAEVQALADLKVQTFATQYEAPGA